MLKNKTLMVTGGTGSFGKAVLKRFLYTDIGVIRIFSRDEKKQDDLRKYYNCDKIKFYIGDVRDFSSVLNATRGVDYIFHAAALKQVPSCEFHPMEGFKTNVIGTDNVLEASIQNNIKRVVCLSTDKAVYPINAMGTSKAMMEKVMVAKSRDAPKKTVFCCTRYGNVMASRGSVIPLFMNQMKLNLPLSVTDPKMTRFMMSLDDAMNLVMYAFNNGKNGDIFVQKAFSTSIDTLVKSLMEIAGKPNYPIEVIGTRHGEKLFEVLLSREEMAHAEDLGKYYRIPPDFRDLNYGKYVEKGEQKITLAHEYNSHNAKKLDVKTMKTILEQTDFIQAFKRSEHLNLKG